MSATAPIRPPLFTEHFLNSRLPQVAGKVRAEADVAFSTIKDIVDRERASLDKANEAQTEELLVKPALAALGWYYIPQAGFRVGRHRQPDYALYSSEDDRRHGGEREGLARYERSLAICEAKRWGRPLDGSSSQRDERGDPHMQTVTYMGLTQSRWAILTDGKVWRLYALESDHESGESHTVDLLDILNSDDRAAFARFYVLFARRSYERPASGEPPIEDWLRDAREHATAVGKKLREQVLEAVPLLASGLIEDDDRSRDSLDAAYDGALTILFRLLFCLYAEARGLLPSTSPDYRQVSLGKMQDDIAAGIDGGRMFGSGSDSQYAKAKTLFRMIDRGDVVLEITEYNGGLFKRENYEYLKEPRTITDQWFAPALDKLSRVDRKRLDYLGLGVRHLGGIYENLLAYRLIEDEDGGIAIAPSSERHGTGSYFTPEVIVDRIVERTVGPIVERVLAQAEADGLDHAQTLERLLEINVLDPAMGSAHFLVGTTLYLARAFGEALAEWDDVPDEPALRRLVAERCCYGVDLNPVAVELARLSLWLATARTGEPLTFLPNLQAGNSLVGPRLADLRREHSSSPKRIAETVGRLFSLADEIEHVPSDQAEQVRHKYELDAKRTITRTELEETLLEATYPDTPFIWDLAFPDVFLDDKGETRSDGGFNAVVGNPPYVEIQSMDRAVASYLRSVYDTAHGSFDLYVPFIERSIDLLAPTGRLGFIVPSRFQKLDYGSKLRGQLSAGAAEEIVDFGHHQVFDEATNYTSVLVADRSHGVGAKLRYRRVEPGLDGWESATAGFDNVVAVDYDLARFGADPWILVPPLDDALLRQMHDGAETLDEVAEHIFQGVITSADKVFLLRVIEQRGGVVRCWSEQLEREIELEPDLLHPIATGSDVERYAFKPLEVMVLFPYAIRDDRAELIGWQRLATATPKSAEYFKECELVLRARERGRFDVDDGWWAFGRTQNMTTGSLAKLGVAQTVQRLEVGLDREGGTFFHNVRVNGIVPRDGGASLDLLNALLGSRLLDWAFRRYSTELQNDFWQANKQFIAPLPIRATGDQVPALEEYGRRLHDGWRGVYEEHRGFLKHVSTLIGHDVRTLPGSKKWLAYENHDPAELFRSLRAPARKIEFAMSVTGREFADALREEHQKSCAKIATARAELAKLEAEVDGLVYELYGLTDEQRAYVDAEYG